MRKIEPVLIALLLLFTFSCSKNNENDSKINDEISFTISFSDLSNSLKSVNLNDSFPTLDDAKQIVLTIETINGEDTKYKSEKIEIFKMNGNYFSQKLSLVVGDYKLTEFFLIDSSNNTIFATPLTGSQQAQNVDRPLPIEFSIVKDQITSVNVEVLSTTGLSPEDFGLVGFIFHEVPTFSFLINVSEIGQMDSLLAASLIISNGTYTYSQELEAIANNVVTIREEFTEVTLNITKEGYLTYEKTFTIDSLKQHAFFPLTLEFKKEDNPYNIPTDGLVCYYEFVGNAFDLSNSDNNGDVVGAELISDRKSNNNNAYSFNGDDNLIKKIDPTFRNDMVGTFISWIKINALDEVEYVGSISDTNSIDYYISLIRIDPIDSTIGLYYRQPNSIDLISGTTKLKTGIYYNVALVADGSSWNLFINGQKESLVVKAGINRGYWFGHLANIDQFTIGNIIIKEPYTKPPFNGTIDQVLVYNRVLPDIEINNIYQSTK